MFLAGAGRGATGIEFWDDVCGFSMAPIGEELQRAALKSGVVATVASADILTEATRIRRLDIMTMSRADMDFSLDFELRPRLLQVQLLHLCPNGAPMSVSSGCARQIGTECPM
jgi:hypothetical protein